MNTIGLKARKNFKETGHTVIDLNWEKIFLGGIGFFGAGFWAYLGYVYIFLIGGVLGFFGAGLSICFAAACLAMGIEAVTS